VTVRVLLHVQHLLGIGHLKRTATLARALAAAGIETVVASGGFPVAGLDFGGARLAQLPPLRARDAGFKTLVGADDAPVDDAWWEARRARLLDLATRFAPDVVVTELFPFGRRQLRHELLPMLDALRAQRPRPTVVASVRDIINARRDPDRIAEALGWFERYYDWLLVHGDPRFVPLADSVPFVTRITDRIRHTGYIAEGPAPERPAIAERNGEVVVSVGGGAVGAVLLEAALGARPYTPYKDRTWRLIAGHNLDGTAYDRLARRTGLGVEVERSRSDFRALLARSVLSISQCGYNTMLDVLQAGTRAVIVPFAGGGETEQSLRAARLAARGGFTVVPEPELNATTLAAAVARAAHGGPASAVGLDLNGAETSVRLIAGWAAARPR
jgi:predicted glycosyltransferase